MLTSESSIFLPISSVLDTYALACKLTSMLGSTDRNDRLREKDVLLKMICLKTSLPNGHYLCVYGEVVKGPAGQGRG